MTQEQRSIALALPGETQFRADIQAINRFQAIVHQNLVDGQDYGVIPGTTKPTLLKPGAEKIAKLLGLADQYEIVDKQEDWSKPFFRYLIRCKLIHVATQSLISEGLGECNSMESKYRYRWIAGQDLPQGVDKSKLVTQERHSKTGGHWTVYRMDNDDIYSQVNTILKMAKKRALVDAALSAGRLSNVFTQDIEDIGIIDAEVVEKPVQKSVDKSEHWCSLHNTEFFKKGKMKGYAHKVEGTADWCNEPELSPEKAKIITQAKKDVEELYGDGAKTPPDAPEQATSPVKPTVSDNLPVGAVKEPATLQELLTWVASHGKAYSPSWVCKALEVRAPTEITDIAKAYKDLKAFTEWQ